MPTFILFKDGNKAGDLVGAHPGKLEVGFWSDVQTITNFFSAGVGQQSQVIRLRKQELQVVIVLY